MAFIVRFIDDIRRVVVPRLSPYPITVDLDLYAIVNSFAIPPNFIWQLPHKVMSKQRMHAHTSGKMVSG